MSGENSSKDPSLDEILATIRKIISEDEPRQVGSKQTTTPSSTGQQPAVAAASAGGNEVLLLTDLIEEPKAAQTGPSAQAAKPSPEGRGGAVVPTSAASSDRSLIAVEVAGVASSAFERLSKVVQESLVEQSAPDPGPTIGNGKTLEGLVTEMLRPMLKQWFDRNLPSIVERHVEREIDRLTRR
jgi:cell pole-organizing protein PopZ